MSVFEIGTAVIITDPDSTAGRKIPVTVTASTGDMIKWKTPDGARAGWTYSSRVALATTES